MGYLVELNTLLGLPDGFEVLSLFTPEEQRLYKEKFLAAAKMTGEVT